MLLNRVVLPAPLGPMRPTMAPSATSSETPPSACSPPKASVASRTSRRLAAAVMSSGHPLRTSRAVGLEALEQPFPPFRVGGAMSRGERVDEHHADADDDQGQPADATGDQLLVLDPHLA